MEIRQNEASFAEVDTSSFVKRKALGSLKRKGSLSPGFARVASHKSA